MQTTAQHALADLAAIAADHEHSHRCLDGVWYKTNVDGRHCPTWERVAHISEQVILLAGAPLEHAADPVVQRAVVTGMTGLDVDTLDDELRDGWLATAEAAVNAYAVWAAER